MERCVGRVVEGWNRLGVYWIRRRRKRVEAFVVEMWVRDCLAGGRLLTVVMSRERCCMGGGV